MHYFALLVVVLLGSVQPASAEPWRLQDQGLPEWLAVSGSERYRVEFMDNTFRIVDPGSDKMTTSRLWFTAEARGERWYAGVELQDSRAWWHDSKTPVNTGDVNAAEFLQAYLGGRFDNVIREGDELTLEAGRLVLQMGKKRIVGRNIARNTVNGFIGFRAAWNSGSGPRLQAFYTNPMERLPNNLERDRLLDNDVENDKSTTGQVFWGVELANLAVGSESAVDLYLVGYDEDDRPEAPPLKRDLLTAGVRAYDPVGTWQYEVEANWQWGENRRIGTTNDLDHRAWRLHAEVSRLFAAPWQPKLTLMYDYASGDSDPTDGKQERFDWLYAARRGDFGMLGLYGPFFYANLDSPALVLGLQPSPDLHLRFDYRPAWLAEKRDIFVAGALVDPNGQSGDSIGDSWQARADWEVMPGQVTLTAGFAWLDKGGFLKDAPGAPDNGDTLYGMTQILVTF